MWVVEVLSVYVRSFGVSRVLLRVVQPSIVCIDVDFQVAVVWRVVSRVLVLK